MKILYVDIQWDYGVKARGINQIGEIGFRQSFIKLGHQVETFYYDEYLANTQKLQGDLLAYADQVKRLIGSVMITGDFRILLQSLLRTLLTV